MATIITIHDSDFNIIYANEDAKRILRLPVLGEEEAKCYDYFHGRPDVPPVCAGLRCFSDSGASIIRIYEPHLDKYLEIRATPLYDTRDEPIGVFHVVREVEPAPDTSS